MAALGLFWSSACGGAADSEEQVCSSCAAEIDRATLDCNAPLPDQLIAEMTGAIEAPPPAPDDADLLRMGLIDIGDSAGHRLLAIDPRVLPYSVRVPEHCVPPGDVFSATLKICVDTLGNVSGVTILQSSLPIIDSQLPYVIATWRYDPYLRNGAPAPFCYNLKYTVR